MNKHMYKKYGASLKKHRINDQQNRYELEGNNFQHFP